MEAARRTTQRSTPEPAEAHTETCWHTKHTADSVAEQRKAVYHNNGGGQPHHPPQAPVPAQHPKPRVGARPTTRALHPRTATAARKQGTCANLKGRTEGLGLGPANGWAALSKHFGGDLNLAPTAGMDILLAPLGGSESGGGGGHFL